MKSPLFRRRPRAPRCLSMALMYAEIGRAVQDKPLGYWGALRLMALADAAFWIAGGDHTAASDALREAAAHRRRAVSTNPETARERLAAERLTLSWGKAPDGGLDYARDWVELRGAAD